MNTPRSSAQSSNFGLLAWLENTRIALPLKGVECRFDVTGAIACVEVDQIFHQNADRPLDCTYTFPLPAGAAVYRCELHVNDRVIRAKVEAKEDARRIYRKQKAAGRRAALVETERENLFTLSLGNVQPDDVIVVRFAWLQVLDHAADGLRLHVPTCPGVRYIPGKPLLRALSGCGIADDTDEVPDASRISPPRIEALHPDAAYFSVEGRMSSADVESGTASSPTHPIFVRESAGAVTVELSGRGALPDRDFVLAWREPKARQLTPQAWRWTEGGQTYALVQLRAPDDVQTADHFPQDFYFLVDRSGSMAGAKWLRTCEALLAFVDLLGAEDRVWITLFESDHRDFAEAPMPARDVLADRGFLQMQMLGTAGGTELLPAARHVLAQIKIHSATKRASVVLITDGQVGNDGLIVRAFREAPHVRVHTFGIDTAVNDAFLKSLARQQCGGCWLQTPDDDISGTIAALGSRLRRPVLTDLAVSGAWEAGRATWPDLHAEEVVAVTLRSDAATPLEIAGRLPDGREHRFAVDLGVVGSEAVKLLWAKERIATLLESGQSREALVLARYFNLICEGAAFIAWDEAEQVQIAEEEIIQPALLAAQPMHAPTRDRSVLCQMSRAEYGAHEFGGSSAGLRGFIPPPDCASSFDQLLSSLGRARAAQSTIKTMLAWVDRLPAEREERILHLSLAAEFAASVRAELAEPVFQRFREHTLDCVVGGSPETFVQWSDECRPLFFRLLKVRTLLADLLTPPEVFNQLIAWVLELGTFDSSRLEELELFVAEFGLLPFSAGSMGRRWRALLESTVGTAFEDSPEAAQWWAQLSGKSLPVSTRPSSQMSAQPQTIHP